MSIFWENTNIFENFEYNIGLRDGENEMYQQYNSSLNKKELKVSNFQPFIKREVCGYIHSYGISCIDI